MKALHSIKPNIDQRYIFAANILLNMYRESDRMQFFLIPDQPERIAFWCDMWSEDEYFRKDNHDSWGREDLMWLELPTNTRAYGEPVRPDIEYLFVEYNP